MSDEQQTKFETWGIVELMGHQRVAGKLSEQCIAGANMLRVDIPTAVPGAFITRYYGSSAIYALHPTDEAAARKAAGHIDAKPPFAYMLEPRPQLSFVGDGNDEDPPL